MISVAKNEKLALNSIKHGVNAGLKYAVETTVTCGECEDYSGYFAIFLLDVNGKEIERFIRWIFTHSGKAVKYRIVFTAPEKSAHAVIGFRVNHETPNKGALTLDTPDPNMIPLTEVNADRTDEHDDKNKYVLPYVEDPEASQLEEYEKKLVWLFGSRRSGTTWLATELLSNPSNLHWTEPDIGRHLTLVSPEELYNDIKNKKEAIEGTLEYELNRPHYLFSNQQSRNWGPRLRRFLLSSAFAWSRDTSKNLIIKEMYGNASQIIMHCLPNSKMIHLIRDGRDTLDSLIDATSPSGWTQFKHQTNTKVGRMAFIKLFSIKWVIKNMALDKTFKDHPAGLKHYVKYESLRDNTAHELRKIYDLIGISISDAEILDLVEKKSFKNIPASKKGPGKVFRAATTGGWKKTFSPEEIEMMNHIMGDTLLEHGYEV